MLPLNGRASWLEIVDGEEVAGLCDEEPIFALTLRMLLLATEDEESASAGVGLARAGRWVGCWRFSPGLVEDTFHSPEALAR